MTIKKQIVKTNLNNYQKLKNIAEASLDSNMNTLMEAVEQDMPFVEYNREMKSVNLYPATCDKLDSFRITETESRDNIITRLLIAYENISDNHDDLWIPFKLISTINKLLVIEGKISFNSHQMMFYEGNATYGEDLPATYNVDGENMTVEFKSWVELLDWNEIRQLVLEHYDKSVKFNKQNYYVEINPL